jgi:hypothetical protein
MADRECKFEAIRFGPFLAWPTGNATFGPNRVLQRKHCFVYETVRGTVLAWPSGNATFGPSRVVRFLHGRTHLPYSK